MKFVPETSFDDHYETARFELTWKVAFFLLIMLPILVISLHIFGQRTAIYAFFGWIVTLLILFVLRKTRQYRIPAFFFFGAGTGLCITTLLAVPEAYHFVDSLWMVVMILYSYFVLGKIWGNICLILNLIGVVLFIVFFLNISLDRIPYLSTSELIAQTVNVVICGICIAYLLYQFIRTNEIASIKYRTLTAELQAKNLVVESQYEEKTVMLREIHHRVKNNLQVITSLLRLQSREANDKKTAELFKESTNRVIAMALIHEKMYQSKDLAKINLEDYLETLLSDLIASYAVEIPIRTEILSKVETISNNALVPLALLFNELVSNSLKHAFIGCREGSISINVARENGSIIIRYKDDGTWREKQKEISFGLELIESLTEQLDGKFIRKTEQGTDYEFTLPDNL